MVEIDDVGEVSLPSQPPPFLSPNELDHLCRQGHISLTLPDLWTSSFDRLFAGAKTFFNLPEDVKSAAIPLQPGNSAHGYFQIPSEKEYVTVRAMHGPKSAEGMKGRKEREEMEMLATEAWRDAAHLLHRILGDVSNRLGISTAAWDPLVLGSLHAPPSLEQAQQSFLRVFRYEPESGRAAAHRDIGLLTFCVCRGRGLEVLQRSDPISSEESEPMEGTSIGTTDAEPPTNGSNPVFSWQDAGEFTILVGDTLRVLSSNRIPAGRHRVVPTDEGRSSIVFALRVDIKKPIHLEMFGGHGIIDSRALMARIEKDRTSVNGPRYVEPPAAYHVG